MKIERVKSKTFALRVTTKKGSKIYSRHRWRRKKKPSKDAQALAKHL